MMQQPDALLFNQGGNPQERACMLQYSAITHLLPLLLFCCLFARFITSPAGHHAP
jgi:hypothetical protein